MDEDLVIYTDASGRPIPKPGPLPPGAAFATWQTWVRAQRAYRDAITDVGNAAFDQAFRKAVKA